jgi:hypothetical protein
MKAKAHKRPVTLRRYTAQLEQHLNDTRLPLEIVYPAFTPEEEARAKFTANALRGQLDKVEANAPTTTMTPQATAARHRLLTIAFAYQMEVGGSLNYLHKLIAGGVGPPVDTETSALGPVDASVDGGVTPPEVPPSVAATTL